MTVTSTGTTSRRDRKASSGRPVRGRSSAAAVPVICPYLIADDGAWRSARASRDHRCGAVEPAAALALDKQRRLCLTRAHATCATRLAALAVAGEPTSADRAAAGSVSPARAGATRWSIVRTAPVVLDASGGRSADRPGRRPVGQWALGGLMALALGAVVLARLPEREPEPPRAPAVLAATGVPTARALTATVAPTARPTRTPRPVATPVAAQRSPSPSAPPSAPATFVVRAGDTLYAIARAHDTTVEALQEANDLGDTTVIRIGQELVLP